MSDDHPELVKWEKIAKAAFIARDWEMACRQREWARRVENQLLWGVDE